MTYRIQVDDTVRDATPDEVAAIEAQHAAAEALAAVVDAKAAAAASARAKLTALGLSEAEVAAIVGG
jgi:hypothetical protein